MVDLIIEGVGVGVNLGVVSCLEGVVNPGVGCGTGGGGSNKLICNLGISMLYREEKVVYF